jgi:hypothetical protein
VRRVEGDPGSGNSNTLRDHRDGRDIAPDRQA